jgi:uncharacterized protein (DUF433 family)
MSEAEIVSSENVLGGEPRIEETRVGVSHVVQYYEKGWNVEKIARELNLEPLQVIKGLEYYYKNPEDIRQIIRERKENNDSLTAENPSGRKA